MAKETVSLISDNQNKYDGFTHKIKHNLMNATDFAALSAADQATVKQVLFDLYSTGSINPFQALSAMEFTLIGLAKLFFSLVPCPQAATPSTPQATPAASADIAALYTQLQSTMNSHDMPITGNSWQVAYLENQIKQTVANRNEYKAKKQQVTGSF